MALVERASRSCYRRWAWMRLPETAPDDRAHALEAIFVEYPRVLVAHPNMLPPGGPPDRPRGGIQPALPDRPGRGAR